MTCSARNWSALLWCVVAGAILFRFAIPEPTNFWEDEIIAATHAMLPFWQVIISSIRYDVHPPLYFLQLHLWALVSHADIWLILNSGAWSIAAIASLWWVARRLYGEPIAIISTVLFSVLPISVFMATQLRMYAMLSTLIIWAFYLSHSIFSEARRGIGSLLGLTTLLIAIVNVHAIGTLAVFFNGLYALHLAYTRAERRPAIVQWLAIYGAVTLCAVPWLITDLLHDANLPEHLSAQTLVTWLATMSLGPIPVNAPAFGDVAAILYLTVVIAGLISRRARSMTVAFLIVPPFLALVTALVLKPVFKWNFFATAASPFFVLVMAQALTQHLTPARMRIGVVLIAAALATVSVYDRAMASPPDDYRGVAAIIRSNYRSGDVVYAPQHSYFWGITWYLAGPDWGNSLVIAPTPNAQWRPVYRMLGPGLVEGLHLMPKSQEVKTGDIRIVVGLDSLSLLKGASRIWMVMVPRADVPESFPPPTIDNLQRQWIREHGGTTLILYAAPPQTNAIR